MTHMHDHADVQALNPLTLPLQGMRLIEASAGTGKTFTIAALYVRLVLGHGTTASDSAAGDAVTAFSRALLPREILVVTFTRAAAEELRGRIRARLQEAANLLRLNNPPDEPFLSALYHYYEARNERLRAVRVLQQAAESMDEAAIFTIHSWCQQVLQQHAFESGAGFNRRLEQDQKTLLERCVEDYWRTYFYPLEKPKAQWVSAWWKTPADLLKSVQKALPHTEQARDLDTPLQLTVYFNALSTLQRRVAHDRERLDTWAEAAIEKGAFKKNIISDEKLRTQLQHLKRWAALEAPGPLENMGPKAESLAWWAWQKLKASCKNGAQLEPLACFEAIDTFLETYKEEPVAIDLIQHAVSWIQRRLAHEKRRLAMLHFDDLVNDVYFALTGGQGPRLAAALRERFPIALIDEFQDTDERQYASFKAIYATAPENGLLLIGDPKQAIYSFRGADIFTYLQARSDTQGRHYSLDTNYRSAPELVSGINHVFDLASRDLGKQPFIFNGIPFVAVNARPANEQLVHQGQPVAPLTLWSLEGETPDGKTYMQRMGEHAADTIAVLLRDAGNGQAGLRDRENRLRPLKSADMAVLVRSRTEASVIRDALAQRGVRSVYLSERDTVFATPEAKTLLAWLQAVAMPEDESSLRVALAEPQLRLSLQALDRLQQDEIFWEQKVEQFKALRVHWQKHGVLPMLRCLLQQFEVPHHLLTQPGGERSLTNLLHLSEWLQTASATLEGEHALIRLLQEKIRLVEFDDSNEELTLRLESDEQLLKIVTIHKSKGLEYPLVFLPFVCMPARDATPPFIYHDDDGHKQIYWEDGNTKAKEEALKRFENEQLAEDLRLFYVAVTRAKYACWLGMAEAALPASKNKPARVLHRNPLAWLLCGKPTLTAEEYRQGLSRLVSSHTSLALSPVSANAPGALIHVAPASNGLTLQEARIMSHPLSYAWSITSYTGIVWGANETESSAHAAEPRPLLPVTLPEESVLQEERMLIEQTIASVQPLPPALEGIHAFPAGAQAGTFLHEIMEWAGADGFDQFARDLATPDTRETRSAQLLDYCEQRHYQEQHPMLLEWLASFMQTPFMVSTDHDARPLRFAELAANQYRIEMEFWLALGHLDQRVLDDIVCASEFPDQPRPALLPRQMEGMLKGFVDLLLEHEGRYYVLDYKSNRLGPTCDSYTLEAMRDAMLHHRYDVQYALYTVALHRLLASRLGDAYDYDRHVGGAIYIFMRGVDQEGHGIFVRRLPYETVLALEAALGGMAA